MQNQTDIIHCYNQTAANYAAKFIDELDHKHLDQILLKAFAAQNKDKGRLIDIGCGPGQTTKYLFDQGVDNLIGTDLSPEMVKVASRLFPNIAFEQADMLKLTYSDCSFGSAIAFYSIVHFDYEQIKQALYEVHRILSTSAEFLFSFHVGNETICLNLFLDKEVNIKFQFFEVEKIKNTLEVVGFEILDIIIRQPYPTEHPTQRAYIWTKKIK